MAAKVSCEAAVVPPNSRSIMSGFPGYPQDSQATPAEAQAYAQQLLMAGYWPPLGDQSYARTEPAQPPAASQQPKSPYGPQGYAASASDVQMRRDIDNSSGAGVPPSHAALQQLQQQFAGSSGGGSDTAGSVQHQSYQDEVQKPAKRGRGRQRKNTGVETAQQRAHRRFYERKKQRMAALEQEAREKQEEYQQLLAINTDLRRKHEALERAVAGRDEHLILIQALGSLSLDAARARAHQQQQQHLPPLQEQGAPQHQQQQVQQQQVQLQQPAQQPQQQQPEPLAVPRSKSSPRCAQLQDLATRADSAPTAAGAAGQTPEGLMPQLEEAGPFGMVQLPQYRSIDADVLPLAAERPSPAAAAAAAAAPAQQQLMFWTADDLDLLGGQQLQRHVGQQQQQGGMWPTGGFLDLLESGQGMSLTRSLSMPARTGGFDADLLPAGHGGFGVLQGGAGGGLAAPHASRSFSTTPTAWGSRLGPLRGTAEGGIDLTPDWDLSGGVFAAAAAREGGMPATRQQQQLVPGSSRHHSWSGAAAADSLLAGGLLPKASLSFGLGLGPAPAGGQQGGAAGAAGGGQGRAQGAVGGSTTAGPFSQAGAHMPPMAQLPGGLDFEAAVGAAAAAGALPGGQQQQQPEVWLQQLQQQGRSSEAEAAAQQRGMWGTITTAGPMVAPPPPCQQALQQPGLPGLSRRDPQLEGSFAGFPQPAWQQQQGASAMPPPQLQRGQHHPQQLQARRSALQQPEPQQVVQQLQQMGDMAFSADLTAQLATADMPDDVLLFDADMMDMLMERMSQQQSIEMLSPLPSIPSALLTGDSLRQAMADPSFAAALAAAGSPPGGHAAAAGQQQHAAAAAPAGAATMLSPEVAPTAAATGVRQGGSREGSPPLTLLEVSRQLQARHVAAGFYPSRSANEMFYVHEIVDWYKSKLLQLQQLLPFVDRPCPDVPCSLSLVQTMEEVIDGVRKFGTRNRIGVWELKLINLETGDFGEAPPSHWAMVAEHIQLPPQMRESAIACYSLYLEYVDKVKADRVAVLQDFQALAAQLDAAASTNSGRGVAPGSLQFRADGYEAYQQLIERLQLSLKREHMVANMLSYSLSQISSHVQMAKGMLACWPYWPDGPSVLAFWLAEEQQGRAAGARGGARAGHLPGSGAPAGPSGM